MSVEHLSIDCDDCRARGHMGICAGLVVEDWSVVVEARHQRILER